MEQTFNSIISITKELLNPHCQLRDLGLVKKLEDLKSLLEAVSISGLWAEINFSYNDRCYTESIVKRGTKCRKKRTITQFYRQYEYFPLKDYFTNLKKSIETFKNKHYNII